MEQWSAEELNKTPWFATLVSQVQQHVNRRMSERQDERPALAAECDELTRQIKGWSQSLANPDLNSSTRDVLETDLGTAVERRKQIEQKALEIETQNRESIVLVSCEEVAARLNRLADVLANNDPTRANLELSLHVESIVCYPDGAVTVRTCKLGCLSDNIDVLRDNEISGQVSVHEEANPLAITRRRRPLLNVSSDLESQTQLDDAILAGTDFDRFAGLGPEWFWTDQFQKPPKPCWYRDHAEEVATMKRQTGMTITALAAHFGTSHTTIARALKSARTIQQVNESEDASSG